jgi:SAM-dependent methyltransferase
MDKLYEDVDLAQFYDLDNGWTPGALSSKDRARDCLSVLDLGCGTGMLAADLALGGRRRVAGVDPAKPMLDIARERPGGDQVRWVEGDARTIRLEERFDLVVLTGHAFQVFLTEEDQIAVLETIANHLAPMGRFIFDSRNPLSREWLEWTPGLSRRSFTHPDLGEVLAWNDVSYDEQTSIATYETVYELMSDGRRFQAQSSIAFSPQARLAAMIEQTGLEVVEWLGGWSGEPYTPASPEIIPVGGLPGR